MVDNRPDTRVSMRTPLARAKGLGAAGHGVEHWWIHRVTAVSNIPLIISFVAIVATLILRAANVEDGVDETRTTEYDADRGDQRVGDLESGEDVAPVGST